MLMSKPNERRLNKNARDSPRPAGRPVMTKTILVRGRDAHIGRPKNDRCLGRLSKAQGEACLGSPIVPQGNRGWGDRRQQFLADPTPSDNRSGAAICAFVIA